MNITVKLAKTTALGLKCRPEPRSYETPKRNFSTEKELSGIEKDVRILFLISA